MNSTVQADIPFHIAFGIDKNYFRAVAVTIVSILENNRGTAMHFHILTDSLPDQMAQKFKKIESDYATIIEFHLPDLTLYKNLYDFSASSQYSPAIFTRLMIPQTLRGKVACVLYLDADILCAGSIEPLGQIDMSNEIVAAVSDELETTVKNRCAALDIKSGKYFNSGVMYINIENWMKADITNRVFDILENSQQSFLHPDQDALNLVLGEQVLYIAERWNCRYNLEIMLKAGKNKVWLGDAAFMHFTGRVKPWLNWNIHQSQQLFIRYQDLTPWKGAALDEPKNYKEMRMFVRFLLPQRQYGRVLKWYGLYLWDKLLDKIGCLPKERAI